MTLYIVPTPIGNLGDITQRAIEILRKVDFIIAEDSRYSRKLLSHLGIHKPVLGCFRPREREQSETIVARLRGQAGALISDSGMPAISDPGWMLIRKAVESGIVVVPLPGPTAFIPALVASGLRPEPCLFLGFAPRPAGQLRRFMHELAGLPYTLIFYESPRRAAAFLRLAREVFGQRAFVLAKELSKKNEKFIRGNLQDLDTILAREILLGEIVILIAGAEKQKPETPSLHLRTRDDIYNYFIKNHRISKNQLKKILMK